MGKEIWSLDGSGKSIEVNVLGRRVLEKKGEREVQEVYVEGHLHELEELGGEFQQGLQGKETKIKKQVTVRGFVTEWWQNPN